MWCRERLEGGGAETNNTRMRDGYKLFVHTLLRELITLCVHLVIHACNYINFTHPSCQMELRLNYMECCLYCIPSRCDNIGKEKLGYLLEMQYVCWFWGSSYIMDSTCKLPFIFWVMFMWGLIIFRKKQYNCIHHTMYCIFADDRRGRRKV